jgi:spore photoproduct lyase
MFSLVYVEKDLVTHPKVVKICKKYARLPQVQIDRYTEVFNRQRQNFRLQKRAPALILAKKHGNFVLKTPPHYGIGRPYNYYFSHLMNCPFDCRYCFLQGIYASAHFVWFVNQEDFQEEILKLDNSETTFFTGYDCDSLAFEAVTGFVAQWLPFIAPLKSFFEFRTKSATINPFLAASSLSNCVVAFTLSPQSIAEKFEHRAPSFEKRLEAMKILQSKGWLLGLRFDPVLPAPQAEQVYQVFFKQVFSEIPLKSIHSISLGGFRVPPQLFKRMIALYPKEPLFALQSGCHGDLMSFCQKEILNYAPKEKLFPCYA